MIRSDRNQSTSRSFSILLQQLQLTALLVGVDIDAELARKMQLEQEILDSKR
jgi:hypothetical protein